MKFFRHFSVLMGLVASTLFLWSGCSPKPPKAGKGETHFKTPFQDESQFIVYAIVKDLAEMACYLKDKGMPADVQVEVQIREKSESVFGKPVYEIAVRWKSNEELLKIDVPVQEAIWDPAVYREPANRIFQRLGLSAGAASSKDPNDPSLLNTLTDLRAEMIEKENGKLSKELADDFGNPILHEKAALLLGAFSLRENAAVFSDGRSELNRLTAHLVMARQLVANSEFGINGQYADVLLDSLMCCQKSALEKLASSKKGGRIRKSGTALCG